MLALLPVGLAGLHHAVLERLRGMAARVTRREITMTIPPWGQSLGILVRYVPVWLLIGTVTWLIAEGLGQDVSWLDVAPATVLSWIVGFVLVPVPGGVGVREAAFVAAAPSSTPASARPSPWWPACCSLVDASGSAWPPSGWPATAPARRPATPAPPPSRTPTS